MIQGVNRSGENEGGNESSGRRQTSGAIAQGANGTLAPGARRLINVPAEVGTPSNNNAFRR